MGTKSYKNRRLVKKSVAKENLKMVFGTHRFCMVVWYTTLLDWLFFLFACEGLRSRHEMRGRIPLYIFIFTSLTTMFSRLYSIVKWASNVAFQVITTKIQAWVEYWMKEKEPKRPAQINYVIDRCATGNAVLDHVIQRLLLLRATFPQHQWKFGLALIDAECYRRAIITLATVALHERWDSATQLNDLLRVERDIAKHVRTVTELAYRLNDEHPIVGLSPLQDVIKRETRSRRGR
jgi:hypothetical protein